MSITKVTINLVVLNGEKYIRHCLDGILAQTYPHELIEINILDNGSSDKTKEIINASRSDLETRTDLGRDIASGFTKFTLHESKVNLGMWSGQEELLKHSRGNYVLAMAVDVILDKDFIKNAVEIMEKDGKIGGLQPKIYKFELSEVEPRHEVQPQETPEVGPRNEDRPRELSKDTIDTCGFRIERSRRVTNIGHGEQDNGQYDDLSEVFGVEGACPFFRRKALEDCSVNLEAQLPSGKLSFQNEIFDHDYFWYGDDLDLAWRMNMFGWKQVFAPSVIAWHDRQTTKSLKRNWLDYIFRVPVRRQIPIKKRRLDWRNTRFTIIKNDYIINILKDLPYIMSREISVLGYILLFEPKVFLELPNFVKLLPKMLRKRKKIMKKATVGPEEIRKRFE
ncbi:MAG: glycosyltransferase family 2 protein [Candidatus Taylorbacteria bacterium]|nr:glycosyltransferase family 2 protein [Candidatus Taylorbacteria bacterium]